LKKNLIGKFLFYIVAFDPIEIWTHLAPQNDRYHLSFVKDIHVVGEQITRNGHKMAELIGCAFHFKTEFITNEKKARTRFLTCKNES